VSGKNHDENNAFTSKIFDTSKPVFIGGRKCKTVNSWNEAKSYIEELPKNITEKYGVLIVQGAHGTPEGKYDCNGGEEDADKILGILNSLKQKHKIGAVLDSCYSSKVMEKFLVEQTSGDITPGNLCLLTSSLFGRTTYPNENDVTHVLETAKAGQTLEDIFKRSYSGLISSARWGETGIASYLAGKMVGEGFEILHNMNFITQDSQCSDVQKINMNLCAKYKNYTDLLTDVEYGKHPKSQEEMESLYKDAFYEGLLNDRGKKDETELKLRNEILRNMLGECSFGGYGEDYPNDDGLNNGKSQLSVSPSHAVMAFQLACLSVERESVNEIDRKNGEACKEFVI
jgi:hypothetical protein